MKPNIFAFIFARGGSQEVPRKNIRLLGGKPLIAYAIEAGRKSHLVDRVIVSTDDDEIAQVARAYGAEVPFMRPQALARNDTPEWLAWQHAVREMGSDVNGPDDIFILCPRRRPFVRRRSALPQPIAQRQQAPPVWDMTTVAYACRCTYILESTSIFGGKVRTVSVPPEHALDIDTEEDLRFAEYWISTRTAGREWH